MKVKTKYDVRPIIQAFEEVKKHFGNSFRYKTEILHNGYDCVFAECIFNGSKKQFGFAAQESEPTLGDNEYWLVYYYELPSTSSIPHRGDKAKLAQNLIALLENKMNAFYI